MLETIIGKLPDLEKLESTVSDLEAKHGQAQARVQSLAHKTGQAREDDLNREAAALNSGRKVRMPVSRDSGSSWRLPDATAKCWSGA